MKPFFTKRCGAYIIDVIIVFLISALITSFIPVSQKAETISENIIDLSTGVSENKIALEKYNDELQNLNYELIKETVIVSLANIVVYLLYFVVYPVYNNGQTVGKKLFKLKIINKNNEPLNMNNLLVRTLILHKIAINLISLTLILIISKSSFIFINNILNCFQYLIFGIILFMIILNKNGRGLHDVLSNTIVVNEEEK